MKHQFIILFALITSMSQFPLMCMEKVNEEGFEYIFNGKNLNGWTSARESDLFSINTEEKAIHVYANKPADSAQKSDHLYFHKDYKKYILKMEFKWGGKKFEPRVNHGRDAGLLFHVHGNLKKVWPSSIEMQIGEETKSNQKHYTTGDLWVIGRKVEVEAPQKKNLFYEKGKLKIIGQNKMYDKLYTPIIAEKPSGQWNQITLIVDGSKSSTFILNGTVVNKLINFKKRSGDKVELLDSGKISLQAEFAEVLYRNIRIKELQESK